MSAEAPTTSASRSDNRPTITPEATFPLIVTSGRARYVVRRLWPDHLSRHFTAARARNVNYCATRRRKRRTSSSTATPNSTRILAPKAHLLAVDAWAIPDSVLANSS